jgi:RNA-directed DNA polymerase
MRSQSKPSIKTDNNSHLYRIWNRLSSGSYFPPPVKAVPIPKKSGGTRILGVPTVGDRIAQTAAAMVLESVLEPVFHADSYGYRPGKSAHDALAVTRQRCWQSDWVLEYDIRALFDEIDHSLLLQRHSNESKTSVGGEIGFGFGNEEAAHRVTCAVSRKTAKLYRYPSDR